MHVAVKYGLAVAGMAAVLGGGVAGVMAQDASKAAYEKRVAKMKELGGAMGAITKVVKGEADYGPATVSAAETVLAISREKVSLFPQGSAVGDSRSKPEIWSDRANFEKAAQAGVGPAQELVAAAKSGDKARIGAAQGAVGKTCGGCHDVYRTPKT